MSTIEEEGAFVPCCFSFMDGWISHPIVPFAIAPSPQTALSSSEVNQ